jgi:hypothetical protein
MLLILLGLRVRREEGEETADFVDRFRLLVVGAMAEREDRGWRQMRWAEVWV